MTDKKDEIETASRGKRERRRKRKQAFFPAAAHLPSRANQVRRARNNTNNTPRLRRRAN